MARPRVYRRRARYPECGLTGCPKTGIPKAAKFISAAMRYTRALYRGDATGAGEMA